ncbi:peptidylprolyl isomerase [Occallatibacter savannae]|uniref:peptidylprolyl isomerase n=1 Tax=Occallatibacter savannae TaxID=1002691 RepID=UPI0013A577DD|nr:peptidylprolyl isomerase [Occallatibacter savannae]
MRFKFTFLALLLGIVSSVSAQVTSHKPTVFKSAPIATPGSQTPTAAAVARVNGSVLTSADLLREEYAIFPYAKQHGGGVPKEFEKQIRDGALKMIIFEELVYQEALRRNMAIPPARMQRAKADFRKQFATPDEFSKFLQGDFGGSRQRLDDKIRRSLLIEALLKAEVEDRCSVTPADVRAFYDKNPARFHQPETYRFQTISILPPQNATAAQLKEALTRAQNALKQAKATKTVDEFGLLAEKISDDDYRVMMGQHKPMPVDQMAPQVIKALSAMKPNDVSDLIQIDKAYTIVKLQEHTPSGQKKFQEVKADLAKELKEGKRNKLRVALDAKLHQNAKIEEL